MRWAELQRAAPARNGRTAGRVYEIDVAGHGPVLALAVITERGGGLLLRDGTVWHVESLWDGRHYVTDVTPGAIQQITDTGRVGVTSKTDITKGWRYLA